MSAVPCLYCSRLFDTLGSVCPTCRENSRSHTLWQNTDSRSDMPQEILDRNGAVVLSLCKVCGAAERQLSERPCSARFLSGLQGYDLGSPRGDITLLQGYGAPPADGRWGDYAIQAGNLYYDTDEKLLYMFTGERWVLHSEEYIQLPLHIRAQAKEKPQEKIKELPPDKPRRIIDLGD